MSDAENTKIGCFQVMGELPGGEGGQGVIYIASCVEKQYDGVEIGDQVAIKVMTVQDSDGKAFHKLNTRTAALAALNHPGILKYYGCLSKKEVFNYYHFVIMEYLHGQTLKQKITALQSGLDADEALRIGRCCLDALCYAQSKNIIHRDLTPSNIFLCDNGDVKLIDFEVAKTTRPTEQTNSTGVFGKLDYMAPELFLGSKETPVQSDIFSFCLCVHEMFSGNLPYERGSVAQAKGDIKVDDKLRSVVVGLDDILTKGLAVNPADRQQSFQELADAFLSLKMTTWKGTNGRTYDALHFVGGGGFGWVYKARLHPGNQLVAIKYLLDVRFTDRFEREAETLKQFEDDRIVEFIDYFTEPKMLGGHGLLVMNYLDGMPGGSLRDQLKKIKAVTGTRAGITYEEALVAFIRYAEGLALLHQATVYHRDLKPSNLYFPEGKPHVACIMDLGVARNEEATLTHMGHVPGTLDYMAPEFARGDGGRGSAASDIYAFGLCLYEALTGRFPLPRLPAGSQAWLTYLSRSVSNPPRPEIKDEIILGNPILKSLMESTIEPDISKRLSNMMDIVDVLKRLLDATPGKGLAFPPSKPVKGLKVAGKKSVAPLPELHEEDEEGATEKTMAVDAETMATMAADPAEFEKLKKSVRADAKANQQKAIAQPPLPQPAARPEPSRSSRKSVSPTPVAQAARAAGFSKQIFLVRYGKGLAVAASLLLLLVGGIFMLRKPLASIFQKPMTSLQMKKDAVFFQQLLADVEKQREQMVRDVEAIETPAAYEAYGKKAAQLLKQLLDGASRLMTVREERATPELALQYFAFAEKTNQVSQLKQQARTVAETKALRSSKRAADAYKMGDMKEGQRQEDLWNEWKVYQPDTVSSLQGSQIRTAKTEATVQVGKSAQESARLKAEANKQAEDEKKMAAELGKTEADKRAAAALAKAEADKKAAAELAKAEATRKAEEERLRMETSKKSVITDEQRRDLAKCDELRKAAIASYLLGEVDKGDKNREAWGQTIKRVKNLIGEQLSLSYEEEIAQGRADAVAKIQKIEQARQDGLVGQSDQMVAKIETLYGLGTPEALVSGDVEQKNWQDFVKEKKCDASRVVAGTKRIEQARATCRTKMASGLLQKALAAYKGGQLIQGDALAKDWRALGSTDGADLAQLDAAKRECESQLKKSVDWGTVLRNAEEEARTALTSQELGFVNYQVTKLAEAIAKAKAADIPVVQATQTLQKLNMYRVVLASPVRAALEVSDKRVTAEWQDEAKQWQPFSRNTRISPGKTLFRFTKPGYKTITQEVEVVPGKTHRVSMPKAFEPTR
ncbi:MAG: protein kinase [bacterium]